MTDHKDARQLLAAEVVTGQECVNAVEGLVAKMNQRIAGLEAERQWQPIETAPKDGTVIDVWAGSDIPHRIVNVSWRMPTANEWWVHGGDTIEGPEAGWHDDFGPLSKYEQPTHWMPLPSFPHEGTQS